MGDVDDMLAPPDLAKPLTHRYSVLFNRAGWGNFYTGAVGIFAEDVDASPVAVVYRHPCGEVVTEFKVAASAALIELAASLIGEFDLACIVIDARERYPDATASELDRAAVRAMEMES